ncbi:hypothetical protein M2310_007441 [Rhizobium leguminosarum]|nr:hypothetical protein [Rhizobium leguminosarum]
MASASGVSHRVKLPRRRNPASYSGQFVTLNFILPMRWRRAALCLKGIKVTDRLLRLPIAYTTTAERSVHQGSSVHQRHSAAQIRTHRRQARAAWEAPECTACLKSPGSASRGHIHFLLRQFRHCHCTRSVSQPRTSSSALSVGNFLFVVKENAKSRASKFTAEGPGTIETQRIKMSEGNIDQPSRHHARRRNDR